VPVFMTRRPLSLVLALLAIDRKGSRCSAKHL
jgi:hypothetical protein